MFLQRVSSVKRNILGEFNLFVIRFTHQLSESKAESCHYPPIIDMSEEGQKRHFRQLWYDSIKAMPTVEEKLYELAIQQLKNLNVYNMTFVSPTYNGVNFQNFITRTHVVDSLPKLLKDLNVSKELDEIRDVFCEVLLNYYCNVWGENKSKSSLTDFITENNAGSNLVISLISQAFKKLSVRNEFVANSTIQQKPRILSFWWHGGFGTEKSEIHEKNLCFQYEDHAAFSIRTKYPLIPILNMKDPFCSTAEVIDYNHHPDVFHIPTNTNALASTPGFWPGDPYEFPFLLVLTSDRLSSLTSKLKKYSLQKIETGTAVMSSFAWLNAIASNLGFTPYHDITYPIVTHTILTNGQDWRFFVYQLNTIAFHNDVDNKDRRNICWCSPRLRLFDCIEDNQVKGINDEVFKVLLQFLHNVPQVREDVNLKPYLGTDTRETDEIIHLRYLLRKKYSRMPEKMAHLDEIPTWVKIYKLHPDAPPSPYIKLE